MKLRPGDIIEKYEIVRSIGSGGAGAVYEAIHMTLNRPVAFKILHAHALKDQQILDRFQREARVMTRLQHPHAVKVYDYGMIDEYPFLVMELLEGHPLESEVMKGVVGLERSVEIILQMCDVLDAAHGIGLVHRDVKPDNIFLSDGMSDVHAVLVDFGLAFIAEDHTLNRLTRDGEVSGTPQFVSPEQVTAAADIGPPTDIYSLGCVFYEMLVGQSVFEADSLLKLLNAHLYLAPVSMRQRAPEAMIPASIDELVLGMLEKGPGDRPSAQQVTHALNAYKRSDDARGRGKPSLFLEERMDRAVTSNYLPRESGTPAVVSSSAVVPPPIGGRRLGMVGEITAELVAIAHTAGWDVLPFIVGDTYDILVVTDEGTHIEAEWIDTYPTIIRMISDSMEEITALLQAGVEDVLSDDSPQEIIRKADRLYKRLARRSKR